MPSIDMTDQEFGQLMFILGNAEGKGITWSVVNPLLMKIGDQLRAQHPMPGMPMMPSPPPPGMKRPREGNKEIAS
jgi:hypothetical protein